MIWHIFIKPLQKNHSMHYLDEKQRSVSLCTLKKEAIHMGCVSKLKTQKSLQGNNSRTKNMELHSTIRPIKAKKEHDDSGIATLQLV
jgi:hypothetical protein